MVEKSIFKRSMVGMVIVLVLCAALVLFGINAAGSVIKSESFNGKTPYTYDLECPNKDASYWSVSIVIQEKDGNEGNLTVRIVAPNGQTEEESTGSGAYAVVSLGKTLDADKTYQLKITYDENETNFGGSIGNTYTEKEDDDGACMVVWIITIIPIGLLGMVYIKRQK